MFEIGGGYILIIIKIYIILDIAVLIEIIKLCYIFTLLSSLFYCNQTKHMIK